MAGAPQVCNHCPCWEGWLPHSTVKPVQAPIEVLAVPETPAVTTVVVPEPIPIVESVLCVCVVSDMCVVCFMSMKMIV